MGADDRRRVDVPLTLREDKRVALLAANRTMAPGLVLEVDLPAVLKRPEYDQVARHVE